MMNALLMVALVTSGGHKRSSSSCSGWCSGCSYACSCSYSCSCYSSSRVSYGCSGCSFCSGCSCSSGCSYGCSGCSWGCSGCTVVCSSCTVVYGGVRPVPVSTYPVNPGIQAYSRPIRIGGPNEPFPGPTLTPVSASATTGFRPVVVYYNN